MQRLGICLCAVWCTPSASGRRGLPVGLSPYLPSRCMLYLFIWLCDRAPPRARALLPRNPIPIVWLTGWTSAVRGCAGVFWGEEARFSFRLVFTYVPRRALGRASGVGSPPGGAGSPTHTGGEPWGDCNLPHIMRVRARVCRDSSRHVSADTRPETPRVTL